MGSPQYFSPKKVYLLFYLLKKNIISFLNNFQIKKKTQDPYSRERFESIKFLLSNLKMLEVFWI